MAGNDPIKQQHFRSIHYLRGIAALMVVVYHIFSYGMVADLPPDSVLWMKHGVAIFFVISGFVMVVSTAKRPNDPGDFIRRRIVRIVPLYWIATLFLFATGLTDPGDLQRLLPSLLFLPMAEGGSAMVVGPVLEVGWTLYLEMAFYLLFAAAMVLPRRWAIRVTVSLLCATPPVLSRFPNNPLASFYAFPGLIDFAGGMVIAWAGIRLPAWCTPLGFALLASLSNDPSANYTLTVTMPALLIVSGVLGLEARLPRPANHSMQLLKTLGDASFAIYLMHFATYSLLVAPLAGYPARSVIIIPLAASLATIMGILVHRYVEQPIGHVLRRKTKRRIATPLPA